MTRGELIGKDTGKIRDSMHKMRDVQSSLNKESKNEVKLYPGRKPSEIKAAVEKRKRKTEVRSRKSWAELQEEEMLRKAKEEVKTAILSDKLDASPETVEEATSELRKAISRC